VADDADISHNAKIFRDAVGQKATVQRTQVGGDAAAVPNRILADLGLSMNPLPDTELKYYGSCAVHIYGHDLLQQIFFVSQIQPLHLYRCPEPLAAKGIDDLVASLKESYGHKRSKLRSGF